MDEREELEALRRMAELEAKASVANDSQPSLGGRIVNDISGAGSKAAELFKKSTSGELNPAAAGVQILGQGVNAAFAAPSEAISSVAGLVPESVRRPIGDAVSAVVQPIADAPHKLASAIQDTAVGRGVGDYLASSPNAQENLQDLSDTAKAAANVALSVPYGKGVKAVASEVAPVVGTGLEKTGDVLYNSGQKAFEAKRTKFVQDLVTPKQTAKVKEKLFANANETGILNKREASPINADVVNTISKTGVKQGNSLLKNKLILDKELSKEADNLASAVSKSNVIYSPTDMMARLKQSKINALSDEPLLVGDGERYYDIAANKMQALVNQNKGTPAGLLKARKEFDRWASSKSGFGEKDSAWRTAVRGVRNTANDYIAEMVPTAEVKASLTKQSHIFDARDAIISKGPQEAATRIGRAVDKIVPAKKTALELGIGAGALGLSGLGLGIPTTIGAALLGGTGYTAAKGLASPTLRKGLGYALRGAGKTLQKVK